MFKLAQPLFLLCETPLHAGSGDSLGIVDLPIQRERHTGFPKIEASSLKGSLREAFEGCFLDDYPKRNHPEILRSFGPDESASEFAGALGFTDARLLLFPVKSMKGVFAWITCPKILRRFSDDMKLAIDYEISGAIDVTNGQVLPLGDADNLSFNDRVVLEEYTFTKASKPDLKLKDQDFATWLSENLFEQGFWREKAKQDILVLSDDDFSDFVTLSTEVITRIKINNETGTVQKGALFTEEYLPAESVLYSLILSSPEFLSLKDKKTEGSLPANAEYIMKFFSDTILKLPIIQLGGNATLGKGLLRTKVVSPKN